MCTHQGCVVSSVADGTITAAATASTFSAADGSVQGGTGQGPAGRVNVTVSGDQDHRWPEPGRTRVADPATYRPAPGEVPDSPGVYRFRDAHGRVVYVGKAKSLRSRLGSYFQDLVGAAPAHAGDGHHRGRASTGPSSPPRSRRSSWSTPGSRSTTRASTCRYRDDKSYPYLAVTLGEEFPRIR